MKVTQKPKQLKVKLHPENNNVKATVTVPTLKGEATLLVMKKRYVDAYFYVSADRSGAEAVFPTFEHVRRNYKALREMTEAEFLKGVFTQ